MSRLNQERQKKLEPIRMKKAEEALLNLGLENIFIGENYIDFWHNKQMVRYYPYSGWASGKSIKDGRGLKNLIKQIKS